MTKSTKSKLIFVCQQCGKESLKWLGRCPDCQEWNSFVEMKEPSPSSAKGFVVTGAPPQELSGVQIQTTDRMQVPLSEFNRVLGGGLVSGSLVLIGGEPGIGKSTLLLQISALLAPLQGKAVYVTGEETRQQIKLRADRLGIQGNQLFLLAETDLETIMNNLDGMKPGLVVIDSIQTVSLQELGSVPGSVGQVRECTLRLLQWAKLNSVPVFISGHVTKEGAIAGPRVLEHMVDVVLYFEGATFSAYRLLRCVKNRFGSTNEVGVFEMGEKGLIEVANPSEAFLSGRGEDTIGSAVVPVMEGNRPLLVEIQALTNTTIFGMPRRTANGVDFNRMLIIIAVLSKRAGLKLGNQDIIVNVAGGLKIEEPAADLGIALSIASCFRNSALRPGLAAMGEIGLNGEIRSVPHLDRRISEAARLGFKCCLIPATGEKALNNREIELIPIRTIREAMYKGFAKNDTKSDLFTEDE